MGHERVGFLPKTKKWQSIVNKINSINYDSKEEISELANKTLYNVKSRFNNIYTDDGVKAAFAFLTSLATYHLPKTRELTSPDINLTENPSPARITKKLCDWVKQNTNSLEYADIACKAGADTIVEWTTSQSKQVNLFDNSTNAIKIWQKSSNAGGFSELSRSFFSHFTKRYLNYFLDREISAKVPSIDDREKYVINITKHAEDISRHAFETAKITQSFAAGWFNNHAKEKRPSNKEVESFLSTAFGKIKEDLQREVVK